MKLTCLKESLLEGLNIVSNAVSAKTTMPILSCIQVEAGDVLKLTANDLEIGIECIVDANIVRPGAVAVDAKVFSEIVRNLPDSEIFIEVKGDNLVVIDCEGSHFEKKGRSVEGFPALPEMIPEYSFQIQQNTFRDMIRQTVFAIGTDEYRPILTGSLLEYKNGDLYMVAIDGYRVAIRTERIAKEIPNVRVVIPGKTLNDMLRILQNSEDVIDVFVSRKQIVFADSKFRMLSRTIDGEYMNYDNIIPVQYDTRVTVPTARLVAGMERAQLVIMEEKSTKCPIRIKIEGDKLLITANTETGMVKDEILAEVEGPDMEIDFNVRYFLGALRSIDDASVVVSFNGSLHSATIRPLEGAKFAYMLLALRS
jgi:DNA polymerase-3 subunit beta